MTGRTPTIDAHAVVPAAFGLVAGEPGFQQEREADLVIFGAETMKNQQAMLAEIGPLLTDLERRLEAMDRQGVDVQVVSPSPAHYHTWAGPELARSSTRTVNEGIAELCTARPDRLLGLGMVPVQHPGPRSSPPTLRDFVVFEEHVEGVAKSVSGGAGVPQTWYEIPTFYFGNPYSVVGPYNPVAVPPGCEALDFELEVAAIVGKAGHDLAPEEAREHIAGYTILNDWSARDLQRHEMQIGLGPAKGKDFANTLGPWIVTADELEPYRRDDRLHLNMEVSINGEHFGNDTLANMAWSFEEMVAYASRGTWVRPGDVLGSGTCGSGALAEIWGRAGKQEPPPLKPGDVVRMTVEGIGTIENKVVEGVAPVPIPPARPAAFRRERAWTA